MDGRISIQWSAGILRPSSGAMLPRCQPLGAQSEWQSLAASMSDLISFQSRPIRIFSFYFGT